MKKAEGESGKAVHKGDVKRLCGRLYNEEDGWREWEGCT